MRARADGMADLSRYRMLGDLIFAEPEGYRPLSLDLHLPSSAGAPVVLFVHGGGWRSGSRREFGPDIDDAFARIVAAGFAVASVDYRLSAEATFPAQVDDVAAALGWLRSNAAELGIDASRVVLWGESAGANLAALVALRPDAGVQGVVDWYGPTDLVELARVLGRQDDPDSSEAKWLGAVVSARPDLAAAASPARQVHPGAPPFLIVHGTEDESVPRSQADLLANAVREAGGDVELVIVEGAGHRWSGGVDGDALLAAAIEFAGRVSRASTKG